MTSKALARAALGAALAACVALPGCLDPFRPEVDHATLQANAGWQEDAYAEDARLKDPPGPLGPHIVETDYTFAGSGSGPYPGLLQVFGVRGLGRLSDTELLDFTRQRVSDAMTERHIQPDSSGAFEGTRTLAGGLATHWFTAEGVVSSGNLFQANTRVRILGEVGYDGRSFTMVVAVAIAQVNASQCSLLGCSQGQDETTWTALAGDDAGTIRGATSDHGLVDHVVTHA